MGISRGELGGSKNGHEGTDIEPGQRISVITQKGTVYEIEDTTLLEGMLYSTIRRQPATQEGDGLPPMTIDDAYLISWPAGYERHSLEKIYLDSELEIIGINRATGERVDFRTSRVQSISSEPQAEY